MTMGGANRADRRIAESESESESDSALVVGRR